MTCRLSQSTNITDQIKLNEVHAAKRVWWALPLYGEGIAASVQPYLVTGKHISLQQKENPIERGRFDHDARPAYSVFDPCVHLQQSESWSKEAMLFSSVTTGGRCMELLSSVGCDWLDCGLNALSPLFRRQPGSLIPSNHSKFPNWPGRPQGRG
jgi:hypothetical protein